MDFSVTCECGSSVPVSASMCGTMVTCACGANISVPKLSELRRNAGLRAFEVSVSDRLMAMNLEGRLPVESECAVCGIPTNESLECSIECERPFAKAPGFWRAFFLMLFAPIWAFAAIGRDYGNPEVHGNELVIDAPIRICRSCFQAYGISKQRCLELLRKTECYDQLLQAYPKAQIQWGSHVNGQQ